MKPLLKKKRCNIKLIKSVARMALLIPYVKAQDATAKSQKQLCSNRPHGRIPTRPALRSVISPKTGFAAQGFSFFFSVFVFFAGGAEFAEVPSAANGFFGLAIEVSRALLSLPVFIEDKRGLSFKSDCVI